MLAVTALQMGQMDSGMLAADLEAGMIYFFERAICQSRPVDRQLPKISALRYLGINGVKYQFERIGSQGGYGPEASERSKIFLNIRSLEYLTLASANMVR